MALGRTVLKHSRVYIDGYNISGSTRSFGPLAVTMKEANVTALGDSVKGYLSDMPSVSTGKINAVLDNTAGASHSRINTTTAGHTISIPIGIRGAPAQGDDVWCGYFEQKDFDTMIDDGAVVISAEYPTWSTSAPTKAYAMPWGVLLHAESARTAVNSSAGVDDRGAATSLGGYMCYHALSSNGTVTIKVQDSADNSSWADLVTSGSINPSSTPVATLVALSNTATVRRYLRWQVVFGTATTVTFVLSFVRI